MMTAQKPAIVPPAPKPTGLALLRQPFPDNQVSKLPKPTKAQTDAVRADFKKGIRCAVCGSWHHPDVIHLDYVGHAALTDRLLDADPEWSWEPAALNEEGLPAFDKTGGLWIKLTVCGVARLGYGHAVSKPNADAGSREKEVIGDALRNAAMRFGAALDLWHKGQLHADDEQDSPPPLSQQAAPQGSPDRWPGDAAQRPAEKRTLTQAEGRTIVSAIAACETPEEVGQYMAGLASGPMAFAAEHPKIKAAADARTDALAPFPGETHPALADENLPY